MTKYLISIIKTTLFLSAILSIFILTSCSGEKNTGSVISEGTNPNPPTINSPPIISGIPTSTIVEHQTYLFSPFASDAEGNSLKFTIINKPSWASFNILTGVLKGTPELADVGSSKNIVISVYDGVSLVSLPAFSIEIVSVVDNAIALGSVLNVTDTDLIQATLDEITQGQELLRNAKINIFNLESDGTAKNDGTSLNNISWNPTRGASTFIPTIGENTQLLLSNAVNKENLTVYNKAMAVIGDKGSARYLMMASNPFRTTINSDMQKVMENSLAWLSGRNNLKSAPFNVVIAHLDESYWSKDESKTREWLDAHYPGLVKYNTENSCDGSALAACLTASTDLLIISQVVSSTDDVGQIVETVKRALSEGISVLYIHHDGNLKVLGQALLMDVFHVAYEGDNRYKQLKLESYNPVGRLNDLGDGNLAIRKMFTHFKNSDYYFNWGECVDKLGTKGENYEDCKAVDGLNAEFQDAASLIRKIINAFDENKRNIFLEEGYRIQKLLVLTADKFREKVSYPMDKVTTDNNDFMRSFYTDHCVYNFRLINPAQVDMGNFSRSDFSHITPVTKSVNILSRKSFRSVGVYAIPGKTVKVTRNDHSDLTVKVFINTLRSAATHQYKKSGYRRPKYLKTPYFELEPGRTIEITSPYGGPIQLFFSSNDLPVEVTFENVGEHAYWKSSADNTSFVQKILAGEYDWAEIATAGFEVHSKLNKMMESIDDDRWGHSAEGLAAAVKKYTSNYPHVLAGFKGEGIDEVAEIKDWALDHHLTIEVIDKVKHMNADQASCGYGCAGNPYDAYWAFDPIGHGDLHELGHGLQKKRFDGFPNHAATNTFSYYTKSRYFAETQGDPDCQKLPFKTFFETIQGSVTQADKLAYLKANLWDNAKLGERYLLKIQAMMHAQKMGKVANGWHILARVHILEREGKRAIKDWDAKKSDIGFSNYSLEDFKSISNNDWLVISYSFAAELDYRNYFDMLGIPYSQKARDQIALFNFNVVPNELFVSTDTGYCKSDQYGVLLEKATLPVDGTTTWPTE